VSSHGTIWISSSGSSNDTIWLSSSNSTIWLSSDEDPRPGTSGVTADYGGRGDGGDSDAATHSWTSSCERGHEPSSSSSEGRGHWYQEYLNAPRVLDQEAIDYWDEVEKQDPPPQQTAKEEKVKVLHKILTVSVVVYLIIFNQIKLVNLCML
jgi:hypothetical protein